MENHVCPCPNYQFAVSASEVTTLWRYTNLFIIIIIIFFSPPAQSLQAAEN